MNDESNILEYHLHLGGNLKDRKYALVLSNFNNIPMKYKEINYARVRQIVRMKREIILGKALLEVKVNRYNIFNFVKQGFRKRSSDIYAYYKLIKRVDVVK